MRFLALLVFIVLATSVYSSNLRPRQKRGFIDSFKNSILKTLGWKQTPKNETKIIPTNSMFNLKFDRTYGRFVITGFVSDGFNKSLTDIFESIQETMSGKINY